MAERSPQVRLITHQNVFEERSEECKAHNSAHVRYGKI